MRKCLLILFLSPLAVGAAISENQKKTLYNRLDQTSITQHLAFYELYGDKEALEHAWTLLSGPPEGTGTLLLPMAADIQTLVSLVNQGPGAKVPNLNEADLKTLERLGAHFPNRLLKGHKLTRFSDTARLKTEEVDLARALFLQQFQDDLHQVRCYEAMIDLMALQIAARLPSNPTPRQTILEMNSYIFEEMGFRFPPHSEHTKEIDIYTILPSVMDSRRGVCLGVSILYLCLSQRLGIDLEIVTPPGHIFVRYKDPDTHINIETTARGIDIDDEEYLSLNTRSLQKRSMKEVIGMVPFNQAGAYWAKGNYQEVVKSYEAALPYTPNDPLVEELLGFALILSGKEKEGKMLLAKIKDHLPEEAVSRNTTAADILEGKTTSEGLKILFQHVDNTRDSLLEKKEALVAHLQKYPKFRSGWFSLASTWLQLHREKEALQALETYHALNPDDANAEYILAALNAQRLNNIQARLHLQNAETLTAARNHYPKALKSLKHQLSL